MKKQSKIKEIIPEHIALVKLNYLIKERNETYTSLLAAARQHDFAGCAKSWKDLEYFQRAIAEYLDVLKRI